MTSSARQAMLWNLLTVDFSFWHSSRSANITDINVQPFVPSPETFEQVVFWTELPLLTVSGMFLLFAVFHSSSLLETSAMYYPSGLSLTETHNSDHIIYVIWGNLLHAACNSDLSELASHLEVSPSSTERLLAVWTFSNSIWWRYFKPDFLWRTIAFLGPRYLQPLSLVRTVLIPSG